VLTSGSKNQSKLTNHQFYRLSDYPIKCPIRSQNLRKVSLALCDWLGGSAAIKDNSQSKTLFGAVRQYKTSQDLPQPVHRSEALM
jgi:hypothetical protein